jgi:tRNA pseudouridine55 synthase
LVNSRLKKFLASYIYKNFQVIIEPWQQAFSDGKVLLIDKPIGWTSFDAVKKIRTLTRISKVGHAGTLDPLATGLLIICTGKFTKRINEYMVREKEYIGDFVIGATTPTYDLESKPENYKDFGSINEETIRNTAMAFLGEISQVPPAHSAIKKEGKPAYKLARKGIDVKLEARSVYIKEFEITGIDFPRVGFRVVCSTGTYIRSLSNDFGTALGCGAYLARLCRTRIGEFLLRDAMSIQQFENHLQGLKM